MTGAAVPEDARKTRARLVNEVKSLRARVADLERNLAYSRNRERALQAEKSLVENIFVAAGVSLACLDKNLTFVKVNPAFAAVLKQEPAFFLGKNYGEIFIRAPGEQAFKKAFAGQDPVPLQAPSCVNGQPENETGFHWTLHPMKSSSDDGGTLLLCGVDFSKYARGKEALLDEIDRLREFAAPSNREAARHSALHGSARAVIEHPDFSGAAQAIYGICKKWVGQRMGGILWAEGASSNRKLVVADDDEHGARLNFPQLMENLFQLVRDQAGPIYTNEFGGAEWKRLLQEGGVQLQNALLAPLRLNSELFGLLALANKEGGFTEEDCGFAAELGGHLALSFKNARQWNSLQASEADYRRLSQALKARADEQIARLSQTECLAEMGQMISAVAHEIRNILHIIQMGSEAMRRKLDDNPEQMQILDEIDYGVGILNTLGNELLDYSKPVKLHKEPCTIRELVANALTAAGSKLQLVKLNLELKDIDWQVQVDAPKITRVLLNVISNAIDAMPEGGTLTLSSCHSKHQGESAIRLSITDTGCGIPDKDIERVQQPFVTTKEHGAGLGISICKKIISAHGGKFLIKSKVNKGTTIEILLPLNE